MSQSVLGDWKVVLDRNRISFVDKVNRLQVKCPFHDDKQASSAVYESSGLFYCWVCECTLRLSAFKDKLAGKESHQKQIPLSPLQEIMEKEFKKVKLTLKRQLKEKAIRVKNDEENRENVSQFWVKFKEYQQLIIRESNVVE